VTENGMADTTGADRWAEALTWHDALKQAQREDFTGAVARDWVDWCADGENQRIFDHVSRLLADRDLYSNRHLPSDIELAADGYEPSMRVAEWHGARAPRSARKRAAPTGKWRRLFFGGTAVAAAAAMAVLVLGWRPRFWPGIESGRPVVYQTRVGELKSVQLRDGSSVILGGRTQLSVAFSSQHRSAKVIAGQAWFRVSHNEHWPFVVVAGDGAIRDVGTAFLVTRDSDRVVVTVTEGTVEVTTRSPMQTATTSDSEPRRTPDWPSIRVNRGEELDFSDSGVPSPLRQTDAQAATAWTHGRMIFDDQPLRYVIEGVNRYYPRQIAVSPGAGALRFSGIVFDHEIDNWLQGLEKVLPVTIEKRGLTSCIHLRDAQPRGDFTCQ
jgi:transmembrane sensor